MTRFRISLLQLLYFTALIAAGIALTGEYFSAWFAGVLLFWLVWYSIKKQRNTVEQVALIAVFLSMVIVIICGSGLPTVQTARPASRRVISMNNMRQITLALQNYNSSRLHFPPAYQVDENGKPMHSWRVLILSELEQPTLYEMYDFDEPWDGPNNSKLADQIGPEFIYFQPGEKDHGFRTRYKLVTGPTTAFHKNKKTKAADCVRPMGETIAVVEDYKNPVNWMQPDDLTIEEAIELFDVNKATIRDQSRNRFHIRDFYGNMVGFLDGRVGFYGFLEEPQQIAEFFSISTPSKNDLDSLPFQYPANTSQTLYSGYFLVGLNIVLVLLPCFFKQLRPQLPVAVAED